MPESAISVVIPTYNRCSSCVAAVESVLSQVPPPLEVIVCDNGSTDETRATFEPDARIRYLRFERNQGGPAAPRNLGICEARGDWVAFLDDDDVWQPGKLDVQVRAIGGEDADVVASDAERTTGGRYFGRGADWRPTRQDLLDGNPVITSAAVARRSLLLAAGGFPTQRGIQGAEDYGLWLALSDAGARFLVIDEALVTYRDAGDERISGDLSVQWALVRLTIGRWLRKPVSVELFRAAGNQVVRSARELRAARVQPADDAPGPRQAE